MAGPQGCVHQRSCGYSSDPALRWRTRVLDGGIPTPCSVDAERVPCHRRTTTQPDDDVVPDPEVFRYDQGCFKVPSGPGLGMSLDEAKLARNSTETIRQAYLDVQRPEYFAEKPAY